MRFLALVLILCTGCDLLFDIHSIGAAADAGAGSDAGSDLGPPHCSPITMLADDFSNDDLATMWPANKTESSNQIEVSGGQLLMESLAVDSDTTLDPGRYFDLREHYFSVRITDDLELDAQDSVSLAIDSEVAGFGVTVSRDNATMTFSESTPATNGFPIVSFPYDPNDDEYLRVGVIGGAVVFGTSPNGVTYTQRGSITDGAGFTFVHPSIKTHRGISSPPFNVFVDDVDGGTPSGAACTISHLRDDFSAQNLAEEWARSEMFGGSLTLVGGVADARTTGAGSKVALVPSTIYDFENDSVSVEIPVMIAGSPANTVTLTLTTGIGDSMSMSQTNGFLHAQAQLAVGSPPIVNKPFDPVTMRWWRIANQPSGMTWETSGDGMQWTSLAQPFAVSGFDRCDIAMVVDSNSTTPGDTQFDNVNFP